MPGFMPYSRQEISDADIAAVAEALRASHLTQGPLVERFEADLARFVGARFAVVFNSGTAALHAAYAAAGVGPERRPIMRVSRRWLRDRSTVAPV